MEELEPQIAEWRAYVAAAPAVEGPDVDELEGHLRDQIAELDEAGLAADEAFFVAVKRMGDLSALSREFAREHSGRLWRQLVVAGGAEQRADSRWVDALLFAVAAAVTLQVARMAAGFPADGSLWFVRNASLLVLPFLAGYFAWRRQLPPRQWIWMSAPLVVAALVVDLYPFRDGSSTGLLVAAHLPVVVWFVVAYPYMGAVVGSHERRMDFVRFTGEWLILLRADRARWRRSDGADRGDPGARRGRRRTHLRVGASFRGGAGAVIVAAWLVESKQRVVENMAPVLTMIFTPLFAVALTISAVVYAVTGLGGAFDRELLTLFDALMVVVLGLVLYAMSARDPSQPPGWMDRIQLVAVVAALVLDAMVLSGMVSRIGELGFTANRTAALGLNLVLLVDLGVTAWLAVRFLSGRGTFHRVERWQTSYLPVFAAWAAVVVLVVPPLFAFN